MSERNLLLQSSGRKSWPKSSRQTSSECCHSLGDWWMRSSHSKEAGHEDSAPKSNSVAMPTRLGSRKHPAGPLLRGDRRSR
jgi:hypothetical protein